MTSTFPAIQLENVVREFHVGTHVVRALDSISLTIEHGEMVAIIGPSGSGKSTLMNTLGCLDQPTSGSFVLNGQDVSGLSDNQLAETRSRQLGFVFQSYNLLPRETALSNVELPLKYSGGYSGKDRRSAAKTALDRVGLSERYDHRPMQMSGGEQQRVGIARALVKNPELILADEPTGNLDTKSSAEVIEMLRSLNEEDGKTIVVVTHDTEVAEAMNRIIAFRDGRIVEDRSVDQPTPTSASVDSSKQ
ncbi:ABC transporter ATP-binding protein [Candidatus Lucifugimonas marina]|jgi:putative ABC transport system ATP-binding protein|uniref:ATP-binding cassette domain-containing protein n=1 Tax=Candidatus Lucifugimonas marina TaxID=3038979 RepID=A0AAJ5ZD71_9CHLR|nr:ATP-binding cassette domain-containing protein [SAR202 cluster bacterium JH702]MDG0868639.1 ATP-binding cassette domain-containing protein [SAR202 cluster bacterium JH639]WFG35272.1 ATP-binding cassette domain-containing protein [SAR202 cluster bacterium JH545]WFG39222.1 ATP-binding cassette domain-containing protein [SAR202 cluster bacterium JH1073]